MVGGFQNLGSVGVKRKRPEDELSPTLPTVPLAAPKPTGAVAPQGTPAAPPAAPPPPTGAGLAQGAAAGAGVPNMGAALGNLQGAPAPTSGGSGAGGQQRGDQGNPLPPGTNPQPTLDQMIEDWVRSQLGAQPDTSQEEALIKEMMGDQIGAGRVGNRASMGRAGFGSSGAEAAIGNDIEHQVRQHALEQVLGVRRDASQQGIDNALSAAGLDIQERDAAIRQKQADAQFAALQALLGGGGAPGADAGGDSGAGVNPLGPDNPVSTVVEPIVSGDAGGGGSNAPATAWSEQSDAQKWKSTQHGDAAPRGYHETDGSVVAPDGTVWTIWQDDNGNHFLVSGSTGAAHLGS